MLLREIYAREIDRSINPAVVVSDQKKDTIESEIEEYVFTEELIEKTLCIKCWSWKSINPTSDKEENKTSTSAQCSGITKAGSRCKQMTYNPNGRCYLHGGN